MTSQKQSLIEKINNKQAKVGIIGLGYVGLPLLLRFCEVGFKNVVGVDVDDEKVSSLQKGKSYINHISEKRIQKNLKSSIFTTDFSVLAEVDVIILCVPTPLNKYHEPDLSYVINCMKETVPHLKQGQMLSLESTTYPGTTEEKLLPMVESRGLEIGKDFFLVYSPEREDPGNPDFTTHTIPKVVGGHTKECLEVGSSLYSSVIDTVVPVSSTKAAEMTKLLENIHRSVNIGLVNEMKITADRMGIDIFEVIKAAASKPFGFVPYFPGPGIGGHCIPVDPFYLTWKAKEFGIHTRFIELAGEINQKMLSWVINKLSLALNSKEKSINNSKILLLGVAYKKNVDDMRESPCLGILEKIEKLGGKVSYSDPYIPNLPSKISKLNKSLNSVNLSAEKLKEYDAVIIGTNHDDFNYDEIMEHSNIIVDTRGVFHKLKHEKLFHA